MPGRGQESADRAASGDIRLLRSRILIIRPRIIARLRINLVEAPVDGSDSAEGAEPVEAIHEPVRTANVLRVANSDRYERFRVPASCARAAISRDRACLRALKKPKLERSETNVPGASRFEAAEQSAASVVAPCLRARLLCRHSGDIWAGNRQGQANHFHARRHSRRSPNRPAASRNRSACTATGPDRA